MRSSTRGAQRSGTARTLDAALRTVSDVPSIHGDATRQRKWNCGQGAEQELPEAPQLRQPVI
jgi:hypothetical protein